MGEAGMVTSPVDQILVKCQRCGHLFRDWWRASLYAHLDTELVADAEYLDAARAAICPACGARSGVDDDHLVAPGERPASRPIPAAPARSLGAQ
jgi:hypothetical protein